MKYILLLLILLNTALAVDFDTSSDDYKSIPVKENSILILKNNIETELSILRITDEAVLAKTNDNSALLFYLNKEKNLDIDNDNIMDLAIKVTSIKDNSAELTIKKLNNLKKPVEINFNKIITISLFIFVLFSIIIYFIKKKRSF